MTKITLCPGPGAKIKEWQTSQKEYFGRGDKEYAKIKEKTLNWLRKVSKKKNIVAIPGAGTTAAYIAFKNFLNKKILIVDTGYYSKRWIKLCGQLFKKEKLFICDFKDLDKFKIKVDWVVFVYVETAECKIFDIKKIHNFKKKYKCKLMLDATASIGLEKNHNKADVMFFSSCKGLFGPTGLGFIAYDQEKINNNLNFFDDLKTYEKSMFTMGYNCLAALFEISKKHKFYLQRLLYARRLLLKFSRNQINPIIGLDINFKLKKKRNVVYYKPRDNKSFQPIFFLGFIKFDKQNIKKILTKITSSKINS